MSNLQDLLEQRKELDIKLQMHAATMGGNTRKRGDRTSKKASNLLKELSKLDSVPDTNENELQKEKAAQLAQSAGITEIISSPVVEPSLPQVFSTNPNRGAPVENTTNSETPIKSESKRERIVDTSTKVKSPLITSVGPGSKRPLKIRDSVADVIAKIFLLYQEEHDWLEKKEKADKKFRKELDDQKERHLEEAIWALTGKKPSGFKRMVRNLQKSGFMKYGVAGAGILGTLFLANKALANVNWKDIVPGISFDTGGTGPRTEDFKSLIGQESGQDYNKLVIPTGEPIKMDKKLTEMNLDEVFNLQDKMVEGKRYPSSAVGRYQILKSTLKQWAEEEKMDTSKTVFNEDTQDRLLKRGLINSGLEKYKKGEISKEQFQLNLAKQWAAVPVPFDTKRDDGTEVKKGESYFKGVGNNKAYIKQEDIDNIIARSSSDTVDMNNVTSGYGIRKDPFTGLPTMHNGVDFKGKTGDTVVSTGEGEVSKITTDGDYGNMIEIDHKNGIKTRYAHLSKINVGLGQKVESGDKIGEVGSTGKSTNPHLHYEVLQNDVKVNPAKFLPMSPTLAKFSIEPKQLEVGKIQNVNETMGSRGMNLLNNYTNVFNGGTQYNVSMSKPQNESALHREQYHK